jgi:hypothetical protein
MGQKRGDSNYHLDFCRISILAQLAMKIRADGILYELSFGTMARKWGRIKYELTSTIYAA